jgi:hypothetical protein
MKIRKKSRLPRHCFYKDCPSLVCDLHSGRPSPASSPLIRKGSFRRSSDSRNIARFLCLSCHRSFSQASFSECFGQKRRKLNEPLRKLLISGVTQRKAAWLLGATRKTIVKKFLFLGLQADSSHRKQVQAHASKTPITHIQFDEMESSEKSKCLPVSIPLVVCSDTQLALGFRVCSMPAKGLLAQISRRKYGHRKDDRTEAAHSLFSELKPLLKDVIEIKSDENPRYPSWLKPYFPEAQHIQSKGRKPRSAGLGELKKGGFDPLFAFNHMAALLRANISRLMRKTWNTTKKKERLALHLALYIDHHNQMRLSTG